jgi:exo-beta-1,3-glucanase (GH17 family)
VDLYPEKEVILTEFGWPGGPRGYRETNDYTGQRCGIANEANQDLVIMETLTKLDEKQWSGVVFEAFRENWKRRYEGRVGPFWGICKGTWPYKCKSFYWIP